MSEYLAAQLSGKTAHTLLAEIDAVWENVPINNDEQTEVHRGPFGAFNVVNNSPEHAESPDVSGFIDEFMDRYDNFIVAGQSERRLITRQNSLCLNESEEDELFKFLSTQSDRLLGRSNSSLPIEIYGDAWDDVGTSGTALSSSAALVPFQRRQSVLSVPSGLPSIDIMGDAPNLLSYYANVVIALLTPLNHAKTPWHVLFLPLAKSTLAGITMREPQDDASLGAFYGTLALSALHRHAGTKDRKWSDQAEVFKYMAHDHMLRVQSQAYDRPKSSRYKIIVMAFLTMAQLATTEGSWSQTEQFLLDTEKFIRLRGLTKPQKSRKVRLLHHCYAYMRIFHESLSLSPLPSDQRSLVQHVVQRSDNIVLGEDDPSFRLTAWDNLDEKLREIKSRELGENDLHLANPGLWTSTLYPEIWGIPESWMILLSQTIRLGNEKDLAESSDITATLSLREFSQRAKALERCILRWEGSSRGIFDTMAVPKHGQSMGSDWMPIENALQALHHGLIIYFYRRVRDVDASTLQPQVLEVKNSLLAYRQHMQTNSSYLAGLVWPAFVAACEAIDVDLQTSFLEWFDICAQHSGQPSLARMQKFVKTVWKQRQQS